MPKAAASRTARAAIVPIATPNLCLFAASKAELLAAGAGRVALDEVTAADRFADDDAAPRGGCVISCAPLSAATASDAELAPRWRDSVSRFSRFRSARISAAP